jgi:hypothetical protein
VQVRNAGPSAAVTQVPGTAAAQSPVVTPEAAPVVVIDQPAPAAVVPSVVDVKPAASVDSRVPDSAAAAPVQIAAVTGEAPVMTAAAPDALAGGDVDPTALLGVDGPGEPGTEPLAWAAMAVTRREDLAGAKPEVAPAAAVSTGEPEVAVIGAVGAAQAIAPSVEVDAAACGLTGNWCRAVRAAKGTIAGGITKKLEAQFQTMPKETATFIGTNVAGIFVGLMDGVTTDAEIATNITELATNSGVLNFLSLTVAANKALVNFPPAVGATIGNAAAAFVQNSFGNAAVAQAFVPVLRAMNLPTTLGPGEAFISAAGPDGANIYPAILSSGTPGKTNYRALDPNLMQTNMVTFLTTTTVQGTLGAAFTSTVNVLLGLGPNPAGAVPVSTTAVADYLGQLAAGKLLDPNNPNNAALSATIGGAVAGLFNSIGGVIATQAGNAFVTLLKQPAMDGQPAVASTLANDFVNQFVTFLGGTAPFAFQDGLLPSLAPAAGVAVTGLVNSLLTTPSVTAGLGQFITEVVPGILGNPGIQDEIGTGVSGLVSVLLGGDLGAVVGPQVGAAVVDLVTNPTVSGALTTFVNTAFGNFLNTNGVSSALASAAGTLATGQLGGTFAAALQQAEIDLKASPAIANGANAGVTAAVAGLLSDKAVWVDVDSTLSSLVVTVLGDDGVQAALAKQVAALVAGKVKGPLGQFIGDQLGAVVVNLATNPVVQSGLLGVVDTLVGDFWTTPGVVTAFSQAAGTLATAALTGDLKTVAPEVQAALRADSAVQAGVQRAVGDAVTAFLGDRNLWAAVDGNAVGGGDQRVR